MNVLIRVQSNEDETFHIIRHVAITTTFKKIKKYLDLKRKRK
jgi:hypothetical protein